MAESDCASVTGAAEACFDVVEKRALVTRPRRCGQGVDRKISDDMLRRRFDRRRTHQQRQHSERVRALSDRVTKGIASLPMKIAQSS